MVTNGLSRELMGNMSCSVDIFNPTKQISYLLVEEAVSGGNLAPGTVLQQHHTTSTTPASIKLTEVLQECLN